MPSRKEQDEAMRALAVLRRACADELADRLKEEQLGSGTRNYEAAFRGLMQAPNEPDPSHQLRAQLQPLVASVRRHYKGFCDDDYIDVLLRSQFGAEPSLRDGADSRRKRAEAHASISPSKSNVYVRLFQEKTEEELRELGRNLALLQVAAYAILTQQFEVVLVIDERDESSSSACAQRKSKESPTESGRRIRWRKRALKLRAAMKDSNIGYDDFRDFDMLGHEYIATMVLFPDGKRFGIDAYAPKELENAPDKLLDGLLPITERLIELKVRIEVNLLDRRWPGAPSLRKLMDKRLSPFIVRAIHTGASTESLDTKAARKRRAQKEAGAVPWTMEERARRLFEGAVPVSGLTNTLVASEAGIPYEGFADKLTIVVGFRPKQGVSIRPGDDLTYPGNMSSIFFLTNLPASEETADYVYHKYLDDRWDVEVDVKETKSYEQLGSGPNFMSRTLSVQVSMLLQNFATFVWATSTLHVWLHDFMRRVFNELMRCYIVNEALQCGWVPEDLRPPD